MVKIIYNPIISGELNEWYKLPSSIKAFRSEYNSLGIAKTLKEMTGVYILVNGGKPKANPDSLESLITKDVIYIGHAHREGILKRLRIAVKNFQNRHTPRNTRKISEPTVWLRKTYPEATDPHDWYFTYIELTYKYEAEALQSHFINEYIKRNNKLLPKLNKQL